MTHDAIEKYRELLASAERLLDDQVEFNNKIASVRAKLLDGTLGNAEGLARLRWQQQNVLRALLKEGIEPAAIKRRFHTDWTLPEIEALRQAEGDR